MTTTAKPLPPHGTLSRHKHYKCRCETCFEGYRTYQRARHRKQGYGTWQPFIDAEPVRQHLLALKAAGIGYTLVADHLGVTKTTITRFIYDLSASQPRKKRTRPDIANRILAITAADITPGMVDATGTRRRIQALAALGWPMRSLGPHTGMHPAQVGRIANQKYVYRPTQQAVADCYEKLRDLRPEDHGILPGSALKTRNKARREGWKDPLWWEDMGHIDDPDFDPAAVEREPNRDELAALRRADIEHLARFGCNPEEIHRRLDEEVALSTVRAIVREVRTGQRRDRLTTAA